MSSTAIMPPGITESVRGNSGWFLALGIVFVIAGVFAFASPFLASLVVATIIGIVLAISGAMRIFHAWQMRSWGGFLWQLVVGIILVVGGLNIWLDPFAGALALTIFVAALFVAKGIFQIMLGSRVRPHDGWGWMIASGLIAILAGVLIYLNWPFSSIYALGILAGISMIFSGWSYIMIALAARQTG